MNSSDKSVTITVCVLIIGIASIINLAIYTNYVKTLEFIKAGYTECYIMGHGTEWMKECIPQLYMEKR